MGDRRRGEEAICAMLGYAFQVEVLADLLTGDEVPDASGFVASLRASLGEALANAAIAGALVHATTLALRGDDSAIDLLRGGADEFKQMAAHLLSVLTLIVGREAAMRMFVGKLSGMGTQQEELQ